MLSNIPLQYVGSGPGVLVVPAAAPPVPELDVPPVANVELAVSVTCPPQLHNAAISTLAMM